MNRSILHIAEQYKEEQKTNMTQIRTQAQKHMMFPVFRPF